ncbi:hypothetical protein NKR19_g4812 [Coniochaeta hoffmannii]|uniref:DUF6594 domain-containing protein n=1 Tax=Coniochaeta hoffmannii TaxID=91930 RepID=A0AA38RVT3_9PEZI|nr:hypothetical protein NKR19_g4812 [Coniochaeta hoffmannii]
MAQKEERTLLNVHPEEVRGLYGSFLASQDMTDGDAFLPADAPVHDFCTTALHQDHRPVRDLLYSDFFQSVQKKFPILKFSEESGGYLLSSTALSLVVEIFQIFFSSSLILIPISALLFGGLDRAAMFGVVVAFVFLFCTVVVLGGAADYGGAGHANGLLHGVVAAYTAVLATFLAQLGS